VAGVCIHRPEIPNVDLEMSPEPRLGLHVFASLRQGKSFLLEEEYCDQVDK
jgi:hypothetical protein